MVKIDRIHTLGEPEVLQIENVPAATPNKGEVRLTVETIELNLTEILFRLKSLKFHVYKILILPDLYDAFASGKIKPIIDRTFPLKDSAEAHRNMESKQQSGKIVVTV